MSDARGGWMSDGEAHPGRWRMLALLAAAELLAMALWFSASAVAPQLGAERGLSSAAQAWLTIGVQAGFVVGALASAIFNLADVLPAARLFAGCALAGAAINAALALPGISDAGVLGLRFMTGVALAGVYPTGMKLMATWFKQGRGLAIGVLVGALAVGSACPHLFAALPWAGMGGGLPPWRVVVLAASAAAVGGGLLAAFCITTGPYLTPARRFDWRQAACIFTQRGVRWANLGYLGHMWELYAMWTWIPFCLAASFEGAGWSLAAAKWTSFSVVAAGGIGSLLAGLAADRWGRTSITIVSMLLSGGCALGAAATWQVPGVLTAVCLAWGLTVVADSAQFSTAISELCDPEYVGTALTMQTCSGFLLTTITIRLLPIMRDEWGWGWTGALAMLAIGPLFGVASMVRLRALPEATRLAGGRK